jgi:hypothetical protein
MIDPFKETMLPLAKAARKVPGRTVSPQTLYRWHSVGIDGITLETIVIGGRMQTSQEALARFFAAVTEAKQSAAGTHPTQAGSRRARLTSATATPLGMLGERKNPGRRPVRAVVQRTPGGNSDAAIALAAST